jgi:ABC-type polysaccharide/polyol phosphate transport system ATPase subunit
MVSIRLENVHLKYPIETSARQRSAFAQLAKGLSFGRLGGSSRNSSFVWALRGLSMSVAAGARVGLIGRNGAGKSTLLKTIAGIYQPSEGKRIVQGQVGCLLSAGAGMDTDVSGLENLKKIALLQGLHGAEARAVIDAAAEFSELGPYLEMPVRTYSSGMTARLSFAIATGMRTDILVVDEMIGAGDMFFIDKAVRRIEELCSQAGIVVMSSHSYSIINRFCTEVLLLDAGQPLAFGKIEDVWPLYEAMHGLQQNEPAPRPAEPVVVDAGGAKPDGEGSVDVAADAPVEIDPPAGGASKRQHLRAI